MKVYSQDPGIIAPLYGKQECMDKITADCHNKGQRHFLVHWDTYMFEKHIAVHEQHIYQPETYVKCMEAVKLYGPMIHRETEKGYMEAFVGTIRCHIPTYD